MYLNQRLLYVLLQIVLAFGLFLAGYTIGVIDSPTRFLKLNPITKKLIAKPRTTDSKKTWEDLHPEQKIIKPFDSWTISLDNDDFVFDERVKDKINNRKMTLILGIGSGRSGTLALQKFLHDQKYAAIHHEFVSGGCNFKTFCCGKAWEDAFSLENNDKLNIHFQHIFEGGGGIVYPQAVSFIGDVASWYLPYLPKIINAVEKFNQANKPKNQQDNPYPVGYYPVAKNTAIKLKIIALQRERTDCIDSWIKWLNQWNHFMWMDKNLRNFTSFRHEKNLNHVECFPHYTWKFSDLMKLTVADGATQYYDDYYKSVNLLLQKYKSKDYIRLYDTYEALNNVTVKREILDWIGMPKPYNFEAEELEEHNMNHEKLKEIKERYTVE